MSPSLGTSIGTSEGQSLGTSVGGSSEAPRRKKKRKKKKGGTQRSGNFLSNALDNVVETAQGFGPGIANAAGMVGHDLFESVDRVTGRSLSLVPQSQQGWWTDDLGKAVVESYTGPESVYSAGSVGEAWNRFHNNPLYPVLDVTAALTGGGAIAGKVGATLAKTAPSTVGGLRGSLIARAGYVPATREAYRAASAAGHTARDMGRAFVPGVREVGGRFAEATGGRVPTIPLQQARNPVIRGRQAVTSAVADVASGVGRVPWLDVKPLEGVRQAAAQGSAARVGRHIRRKGARVAQAERQQLLPVAKRLAAGLDAPSRTAWFMHHTGLTPETYGQLLDAGLAEAKDPRDISTIKAARASLTDDAIAAYHAPSQKLAATVAFTQKLADDQMSGLILDGGFLGAKDSAERVLLSRRMLLKRVAEGARTVDTHPAAVEPVPGAVKAGRQAARLEAGRVAQAEKLDIAAAGVRAQGVPAAAQREAGHMEDAAWRKLENAPAAETFARQQANRVDVLDPDPFDADVIVAPTSGARTAARQVKVSENAREAQAQKLERMAKRIARVVEERGPQAAAKVEEVRRPRTRADVVGEVKAARSLLRRTMRGAATQENLVDLFDWSKGTAVKTQYPLFNSAWDDFGRVWQGHGGDGQRGGSSKPSTRPLAQEAMYHFLEQYAAGKTGPVELPAHFGAEARRAFEGMTYEQIAQGFEAAGIDRRTATTIATARRKIAEGEGKVSKADDPMNDPSSPFYDEADAETVDWGEVVDYVMREDPKLAGRMRRNTLTKADRGRLEQVIRKLEDEAWRVRENPSYAENVLRRQGDAVDVEVDPLAPADVVLGPKAKQWARQAARLQTTREKDAERMLAKAAALREKAGAQATATASRLEERAQKLLTTRTKQEQMLWERAAKVQNIPLNRMPGYHSRELATPDGSDLYADIDAARTTGQMRKAADEAGASYFPLHAPQSQGRGIRAAGGGGKGSVVSRGPDPRSVLGGKATEYNALRARNSTEPATLFESAEQLIRLTQANTIYNDVLRFGIRPDELPTDWSTKDWVLLDRKARQGLAREASEASAAIETLQSLVGGDPELAGLAKTYAEQAGAAIAGSGDVVAIPRVMWDTAKADMRTAGPVVKALVDRPLSVFRFLVLNSRPAWAINGTVGAHTMLAVKHSGPTLIGAYVDYLRTTKGPLAAQRFGRAAIAGPEAKVAWDGVLKEWAGEMFGQSLLAREGVDLANAGARRRLGTKVMKAMTYVPDKIVRFDTLMSGDIPRAILAVKLLKPHVRLEREANPARWAGKQDYEVAEHLLASNKGFREHIVGQVMDDLIDYGSMSPFEQNVIRRAVPFYSWFRGMGLWSAKLGLDDPWRADVVVNLGHLNPNDEEDLPQHLRSAVFLGQPGADNVQTAFTTQGINPLYTMGDIISVGRDLLSGQQPRTGGGTLASQLNPAIGYGISSITGNDLFTGAPIDTPGGGVLGRFAWQHLTQMPPLVQPELRQGSRPNSVYASPARDYWASYAGLPIRRVRLDVAAQRAAQDRFRAQQKAAGY